MIANVHYVQEVDQSLYFVTDIDYGHMEANVRTQRHDGKTAKLQ